MVILNGKKVEDEIIDPAKHKFIGTFRYPQPPVIKGFLMCQCGNALAYVGQEFDHWQKGHFDLPQYADLEGGPNGK